MPPTLEILAAEGADVKIGCEIVHVAEMPWTKTLGFLKKLSGFIGKFIKTGPTGGTSLDLSNLIEVIGESESLAAELIAATTGKDAAWLAEQSPRAALALLKTAVEVNFTDELKSLGNDLGRKLGFGAAPTTEKTPN